MSCDSDRNKPTGPLLTNQTPKQQWGRSGPSPPQPKVRHSQWCVRRQGTGFPLDAGRARLNRNSSLWSDSALPERKSASKKQKPAKYSVKMAHPSAWVSWAKWTLGNLDSSSSSVQFTPGDNHNLHCCPGMHTNSHRKLQTVLPTPAQWHLRGKANFMYSTWKHNNVIKCNKNALIFYNFYNIFNVTFHASKSTDILTIFQP